MTYEDFYKIMDERLDSIRKTLSRKAEEYADGQDRLVQFKRASALIGNTSLQACAGMAVKHFTSIYELIQKDSDDVAMWEEKFTDAICYCILMEAIVKED